MPDEPHKEEPQRPDLSNPAPSIFDIFAKGRVEKPREIWEEEREKAKADGWSEKEVKDEEKMRKELGEKFLALIPPDINAVSYETNSHLDEDREVYKDLLVECDPLRQVVSVRLEDYPRGDILKTQNLRRVFEHNAVSYPAVFRDNRGKIYSLLGSYYNLYLGQNDKDSVRFEYSVSDPDSYNDDSIPVLDAPSELVEKHMFLRKGLTVTDLEFLQSIIGMTDAKDLVRYA